MARKKKPCVIDGCERPKCAGSTRWCYWHWLARQSMTDQVTAAQTRLDKSQAPAGSPPGAPVADGAAWCLDCQAAVPDWYMHNGKRCRACESGRLHGKRVETTYGITAAEYAAKLAEQDGRCAICRGVPRSKRLAVDHNHKTGAVRGLLCKRCNHDLLGAAHDSIEMLERAVGYLREYEALSGDLSAPTGCTDDPPF